MPMPISKSSTTMMNRVMVLFFVGGGESIITERRSRERAARKESRPHRPGEVLGARSQSSTLSTCQPA
jgi:hypothetical protein